MPSKHEPVAIVGMSVRFPGGEDVAQFWQLLLDGREAIGPVPAGRWNLDALRRFNDGEPLPYNATHGGWLPSVRMFDHAFFRMSPREARTLDPKQRLALEVVYEAFEDANLAPLQLRPDHVVGMFLGTAQSEYLMRFYNRMEVGSSRGDRYIGPGNDASFSAGRISAMFGLEGPSVNVNTACSTSLVAVHQAVRAIQNGECDVAAAGGVSIIHSPEHSLVMEKFGVLSPDSRCKAFDASADGYVRAEGCGVVILRKLSDAIANGDRIHAVLRGSASNHNGLSDNLMAPDTDAQTRLLRAAVADAQIDPGTVDAIEAHGTGTTVGDPIEIHALATVFGDARGDRPPIRVGSVKTNIGHLEVAAGIAGLVKAVLCVREASVPAHLNLTTLNPAISAALPFEYPKSTLAWPALGHPRRAVVNSFGISGINAAVIVEQAPAPAPAAATQARPLTVLPLSAYGDAPLHALAGRYDAHLAGGADLTDVAFTAATGREAWPSRAAIVVKDSADARAALDALAQGRAHEALRTGDARNGHPKVAFLFTGQGAQHVGMGRDLYASEPVFRAALDDADQAIAPHLGRSIRAVMFGEDTSVSLDDTALTQPALFAIEHALAALWRAWGVEPDLMVGHSIGEIAAAVVAEVMSLDDAAALVVARGKLMQALPRDGAMAAIFSDVASVRSAIAGRPGIDVAADNGPKSTVISGRADVVDLVCAAFDAQGIAARRLTVSHAFHSPLMEPMLDAFGELVRGLKLSPPKRRIVSNVTGAVADASMATVDYWVRHVRGAVRFREAMVAIGAESVNLIVEIGPDGTLIGMGRRCVPELAASWLPSSSKDRPTATLAESVAGMFVAGGPLRWSLYWSQHRANRVNLPRYPFQRKEHFVEDPGPGFPAFEVPAGVTVGLAIPGLTAATAPARSATAFDSADFYRMRWMPIDAVPGVAVARGTWIVGVDQGGALSPIAAALESDGHTVVRVTRDADPSTFKALVASHAATLRGWIHGWALDAPADDQAAASWWTAQQDNVSVAALHIFQAVIEAAPNAGVWTITRGADAVHPGEAPALAQATVWGVARVVSLEHRGLTNVRVDLDPTGGVDGLLALLRATPRTEDQLAFRRRQTFALRLVPHAPSGAKIAPRANTAWVISGGLGALGLAVAVSLVDAGATNVVLCGRSAPGPDAQATIAALRARGATVDVASVDVADLGAVNALFASLDARGVPVRGVVHAAGVLADGPVMAQDRTRFLKVFPAKVEGAWNLHVATRDRDLHAFVLFSSVTSSLGAPGQVNYAAANAFMDALAWSRHARGLPAVSINWGPWGEIGMAARLSELMASRGMGGVRTADGVSAMIRSGADLLPQVSFMDMRVHTILERDPAFANAPLVREIMRSLGRAPTTASAPAVAPASAPVAPPVAAPVATAVDVLKSLAPAARPAQASAELATIVEGLLGVDAGSLSRTRPLSWQGFDSVMAIDLNRAIGQRFGATLPQEAVTVGPSVDELATRLLEKLALPAAVIALPVAVAATVAAPAPVPAPALRTAPVAASPAPAPVAAPPVSASAPAAPLPVTTRAATPIAPGDVRAATLAWLLRTSEELLGFQPGELDPGRPLAWQGFDSVMAVDLYRRIRDGLGAPLPLDRLLNGPRLTEVADELAAVVEPSRLTAGEPAVAAPAPFAATPALVSATSTTPAPPAHASVAAAFASAAAPVGAAPAPIASAPVPSTASVTGASDLGATASVAPAASAQPVQAPPAAAEVTAPLATTEAAAPDHTIRWLLVAILVGAIALAALVVTLNQPPDGTTHSSDHPAKKRHGKQ